MSTVSLARCDDNITWSLAGSDSGDFDITGGVLTFEDAPDYGRGGLGHREPEA